MALRFTFDPNRCTGCQACVVGCWMANRDQQSGAWRHVPAFNAFRHPDLPRFHLSLACHHCDEPACLANCPADAYTKDPVTGAVTLHRERCMGCRYCTWACPHDAPHLDAEAGTVEKCTFCPERLADGLEPACVARCPVEALGIEGREEQPTPMFPGIPPSTTKPGLRIVPLRRDAPPELGFAPAPKLIARFLEDVLTLPTPKITLRGEWSLVVFTTVVSVLVAWFAASRLGGPHLPLGLFLGAGAGVMALATAHLGRPDRAWRAVLNLRGSWLSREILLTSTFLGLGGLVLLAPGLPVGLAWAAGAAGFGSLFAIDRIYRVALKTGPWNLHSAHVLFNGLYLLALLVRNWPLAGAVGLLKLGLYLHRRRHFAQRGRPVRHAVGHLRVLVGFLAPLLLARWVPGLAALAAVLGDLIDRCEYYADLAIPTPLAHLTSEVRRRLA